MYLYRALHVFEPTPLYRPKTSLKAPAITSTANVIMAASIAKDAVKRTFVPLGL